MINDVLAVDMHDAGRLLGVSPRTVWTLLERGEIPSSRIGKRRVISVDDLKEFIRRKSYVPAQAQPEPVEAR